MKITEVIWLKRFLEKIAVKHRVSGEEVEQLFLNRPRFELQERGDIRGEDLYREPEKLMPVGIWLYFLFTNVSVARL